MAFDFNMYYMMLDKQASLRREKEEADNINQYNYFVEITNKLLDMIIEQANIKPPIVYSWVVIGGKKFVSWEICDYKSYDEGYSTSLNLLPDGRLMLWHHNHETCLDFRPKIKKVNKRSDMFSANDKYYLSDVYDGIFARRDVFGIVFDPSWPEACPSFR